MIKKITLLFLLHFTVIASQAQIVSSCTAPDSVVKKYVSDADYLALQRVIATGNTYKDSVIIPQPWTDTSLRALLAVYNVVGIPARDSVVKMYNVHQYRAPILRYLSLSALPTEAWMVQLKSSIVPTGNATLDNLITKYRLRLASYTSAGAGGTHTVDFYSDSNYNVAMMQTEFMAVSGVQSFNGGVQITGDGSYILDTVTTSYVALSYWYRWGDCPSGCLFYHYWSFRVGYDCKVTYMGSGGAKLDPVVNIPGIQAAMSATVYPNPATDEVTILITPTQPVTANTIITDVTGRVVYSTGLKQLKSAENTITIPVQPLAPGTYFYRLTDDKGYTNTTGKIIKQ